MQERTVHIHSYSHSRTFIELQVKKKLSQQTNIVIREMKDKKTEIESERASEQASERASEQERER